jgi:sulfate adenylyltransferase subunit 1 (EFTu-like GTPase family)
VSAEVCWFDAEALDSHRPYLLKHGTRTVRAHLAAPEHRIDVDTLEHRPADSLTMNDIGRLRLSVQQPLAFEPYDEQRSTGAFILIDEFSNRTVAAGTVAAGTVASNTVASNTSPPRPRAAPGRPS